MASSGDMQMLTLIATFSKLKKEKAVLEKDVKSLLEKQKQIKGCGLVQSVVSCSEAIDLVRVSDKVLRCLEVELLVSLLDSKTHSRCVEWAWMDKEKYQLDKTAFVKDPENYKRIMVSWRNSLHNNKNTAESQQFDMVNEFKVIMNPVSYMVPSLKSRLREKTAVADFLPRFESVIYGSSPTYAFTADVYDKLMDAIQEIRTEASSVISDMTCGIVEGIMNTCATLDTDIATKQSRMSDVTKEMEDVRGRMKAIMETVQDSDEVALDELFDGI
jgi:hypothetical protein